MLSRRVGGDEEILRHPLHDLDGILRAGEPAEPPAGHSEVFREAVDHVEIARAERERGAIRDIVGQTLVDLVDDERRAALSTEGMEARAAASGAIEEPVGLDGEATTMARTPGTQAASASAAVN